MQTTKTLIRLHRYAVLFESLLGANVRRYLLPTLHLIWTCRQVGYYMQVTCIFPLHFLSLINKEYLADQSP